MTQPTSTLNKSPEAEMVLDYAAPLPGLPGWLFKHVPAFDSLRRYSPRRWAAT